MKANALIKTGVLVGAAQALDCKPAAIQSVLPSGATVNFAYTLGAGSQFVVPSGDLGYPNNVVGLPALCAVSVQVASIGNSSYGLGLWNGRFQAVGNGGFAGGINWLDMVCLNLRLLSFFS
jgi:feruloyl esterase